MKKTLYTVIALLFTAMSLIGCKDGSFGGDYEVEGVELQEMCGTWVCSVEANDPWLTMLYYSEKYSPEFMLEAFGEPYGITNPDANGDGVVDMADFALYEEQDVYADFYGEGPYEFITSNTAANNTKEMLITDGHWEDAYKVNVDLASMTFSVGQKVANPYKTLAVEPADIKESYLNDDKPVVLGGKILKKAAHAPGSGMLTDSIFFYVKYADDYGDDAYYKVSGYLKTGYTEDE